MLTQKKQPTCSTEELTSELAQEIYSAIKANGWSWERAFTAQDTNFDFSNCKAVSALIAKVEGDITICMSGDYVITPAVPPVIDPDTQEIVKEGVDAVYFVPSTKGDLVASIESLLDVGVIIDDILEARNQSWKEFKESFEEEI